MGYRGSTSRTACVEVDVDFDLDDFAEEDLIDYLEDKGYTVMEGKVNTKYETFEDLDKKIWQLYLMYISCNGAGHLMDKELGDFFAEYYNKVSV
jgi:hypothetical protein